MNSRMLAGLCSVSLRGLPAEEVIRWAVAAGLVAIEWGADVHVPAGDPARARAVARLSTDAGLICVSYGSYWRAGVDGIQALAPVLDSACALGAAVVRIWAGAIDAREASLAERQPVVSELHRACAIAERVGLRLSLESHDQTLTATAASTALLLQAVGHPSLGCHWQPPHCVSDAVCLDGLAMLGPWLEHLHVFHWWPSVHERRSLADGADRWARLLAAVDCRRSDQAALLEFLPAEDRDTLCTEAAVLRRLIAG